jgi:predicted dehydrogenase
MAKRRIAVVGCGSIGRRHARVLSARQELAVELCESHPDHLQRALREVGEVPTHASFESLLATRPELVVIATPHRLHAEMSIRSLQAGCHVLCEKPMSDSLAQARRMLEAAEASRRVFSVGFTYHFHPVMQHLKELIREGTFGRILSLHFHVGTYLTLMNSISRHQAEVEGAIAMDYAHQPDLYYWWLGKMPVRVYAAGCRGGDLPLQSNPNLMAVTLEYEESLIATIHMNYVQHPDRGACEVIGDRGWALFDMRSNSLRLGNLETESETVRTFDLERDPLMANEHQAFLEAVAARRPPESPAREAIQSMRIVEAIIQSWRQGRPVAVEE